MGDTILPMATATDCQLKEQQMTQKTNENSKLNDCIEGNTYTNGKLFRKQTTLL